MPAGSWRRPAFPMTPAIPDCCWTPATTAQTRPASPSRRLWPVIAISDAKPIHPAFSPHMCEGTYPMVAPQVKELLLQSLEHERGGVLVYQTALECVINDDLKEEWTTYLAQTRRHVEVLSDVCAALGLDSGEMTPGCKVVDHTGKSLVMAMKMALAEGDAPAAELVACECVVLAETKDHADWQLIGECAKGLTGDAAYILK